PIEAVNEVVTASIEPIAPQLAKKMQINGHENNQETAGWDEFYKFMKKSLRYPVSAHKSKIMGTTMIKFTVAGGQIENVGIATKLGGGCDAEALRNIVLFPDYKSIKDGKYTLKVKFMLQDLEDPNAPILNEKIADLKGYTTLDKITIIAFGGKAVAATNDNDKVYDFVSIETAPGFPGGMQGFYA